MYQSKDYTNLRLKLFAVLNSRGLPPKGGGLPLNPERGKNQIKGDKPLEVSNDLKIVCLLSIQVRGREIL